MSNRVPQKPYSQGSTPKPTTNLARAFGGGWPLLSPWVSQLGPSVPTGRLSPRLHCHAHNRGSKARICRGLCKTELCCPEEAMLHVACAGHALLLQEQQRGDLGVLLAPRNVQPSGKACAAAPSGGSSSGWLKATSHPPSFKSRGWAGVEGMLLTLLGRCGDGEWGFVSRHIHADPYNVPGMTSEVVGR